MVQSLINPDIHHKEDDSVDPEDVGHEAMVCEMAYGENDDQFMMVAFGKVKYTYHDRGLLYYPLYLLTKGWHIKSKIGVVEVPVKHAIRILDENKEIRLNLLEDPLLFAFANEDYLDHFHIEADSLATRPKTTIETDSEPNNVDDDDASESVKKAQELLSHGIFKKSKVVVAPSVPEETETEAKALEKEFQEKKSDVWVQRFLKNDRYSLHTVHGTDTDTLLSCICDAFQQIGQDTTVAKLRALLAVEATASVFKERREVYEQLTKSIETKELTKETAKETVLEKRLLKEIVGESFREVTSLQHFREFVMTNRFHIDFWAMGVLEKKLSMKLVILDESEFQDGGDQHHVISCSKAAHHPDHYVVVSKSAEKEGRYSLVTYKNKADHDVGKRIFAFTELPYGLKHKHIAQQCAENGRTTTGWGHEIADLASRLGYQDGNERPSSSSQNDIVFQFHRKASTKASPGQGPNEHIPLDQMQAFQGLRRRPFWRRMLDDTWASSKFELDGKSWASVTHYTQSATFRETNPDYADTFALESRTALSKNVDLALAATKDKSLTKSSSAKSLTTADAKSLTTADAKSVTKADAKSVTKADAKSVTKADATSVTMADAKSLTETDAKSFDEKRTAALHAKFTQNADLKQVLQATLTATLMQYKPKHLSRPDEALMAVRDIL